MRRTRLFCAIGVSLCAVTTGSQAPTGTLPEALRAHVRNERFDIVTSIRGLPLGVRDGLQTLFGSQTLDIAEPGAGFQVTPVAGPSTLPTRRLVAAGCSIDHCLVYYERGGAAHTWQVALFHWTPAATRFEWGGTAPRGLATIDDVRNGVLSGAIKGSNRVWQFARAGTVALFVFHFDSSWTSIFLPAMSQSAFSRAQADKAHDVTTASLQLGESLEMTFPPVWAGFAGLYERHYEGGVPGGAPRHRSPADAEDVL